MLGILNNLLTGQLPDAVGLMVFGLLMVGTSMAMRRILGEQVPVESDEIIKERI